MQVMLAICVLPCFIIAREFSNITVFILLMDSSCSSRKVISEFFNSSSEYWLLTWSKAKENSNSLFLGNPHLVNTEVFFSDWFLLYGYVGLCRMLYILLVLCTVFTDVLYRSLRCYLTKIVAWRNSQLQTVNCYLKKYTSKGIKKN